MKYSVSTKHCTFSDTAKAHTKKYMLKIEKILPDFASDALSLNIVIQKYHQNSLRRREKVLTRNSGRVVRSSVDHPVYFQAHITFPLPLTLLAATTEAKTMDGALKEAFEKLTKEIASYKGKHFKTRSDYKDRKSLREVLA